MRSTDNGGKTDSRSVSLVKCSGYLTKLSSVAKKRYESKVVSTDLNTDPHVIEEWSQNLEYLTKLQWNNVVLYMVSTPSLYTKEAIKVRKSDF